MRRTITALLVALGLVLAGCSRSPEQVEAASVPAAAAPATTTTTLVEAPPPPAEPTTTVTAAAPPPTFEQRLAEVVGKVADRDVAVTIVDAAGTVLVDHRSDVPLVPASTIKLLTAAAALAELGPEHRYVTRVNSTAPVTDGVIHGDVVLIGAGDPALSHGRHAEAVPERPRTPIEALADQIAGAGTTRITGRLIADSSIFPPEPVAPGARGGTDSSPYSAGVTVDGGRRVWHDGQRLRSVVAPNPAQQAADVLAEALALRGIAVEGGTAHAPTTHPAPLPLAEVASPPLAELLRWMVQASDNHVADAVFRTIGAKHGDASWAGSARAVTDALARLGLAAGDLRILDGSGLSHLDRVTTRALVALDATMARSELGGLWYSLPAVAASSGTLRNRLVGTAAAGRVAGKTGTLRDVRAFAGFVTDGRSLRHRVAVIGNGLDDAGVDAVVAVTDELLLLLAESAGA